jgi:pilus assembly protein TadC
VVPAVLIVAPAAALAGLGAVVVLHRHPVAALVAGAVIGVGGALVLHRLLGEQRAADRAARLAADLPLALDLLGACLAAGVPVAEATVEVGTVLATDLGRALVVVGRSLVRGVPDERAWSVLDRGGVPAPVVALARAAVRSAATGSALEPWLAELAAQTRGDLQSEAAQAAARAGVLAVVPLGLCALPAYVLLAVVPAVVGLLRHLR